jgi:hypothetical protein
MESLKMDLPALAEMLRSKGRNKDTVLAHITPKEAALLKKRGGAGTINPNTGLPEFDDELQSLGGDTGGTFTPATQDVSFQAPTYTAAPSTTDTSGGYGLSTGAPTQSQQFTTDLTSGAAPQAGQTADYLNQAYGTLTPSTFGQLQPGISTPIAQQVADTSQGGATGLVGTPAGATQQATQQTTQQPTSGWLGNAVASLTSPSTLAKLGLAGGLGLLGASQARKTANQVNAVQGQEQAIAQPYQTQGQALINQAQAGQLSPESQQAYNAAKAQINQQIANTGGVGVQQAANQLANTYQSLLNNQYTYGLNVMQIGDNISLGAIKTGLQLDTQLNTATTNFYSQLAQMVAGTNIASPGIGKTI